MKIKRKYNWKIALILSAIFAFPLFSFSQNDFLELLPGSERLSYDKKSDVERLRGPVGFTYQGNIMYCDSAHFKRSTKEVWAFGKVQLNKADSLNLFCDKLYYNGKTKIAKLQGNVRVRDREYKLSSKEVEYNANTTMASYRNGAVIENIETSERISSKIGYFFPNTQESYFRGNVLYKSDEVEMRTDTLRYNYLKHRVFFYGDTKINLKGQDEKTELFCSQGWYDIVTEEGVLKENAKIYQKPRIIQGDSLYYSKQKQLAIGVGNIQVNDTAQRIKLYGDYFKSDQQARIDLLTDCPLIELYKGKDTSYLRADTLYHFRDTLNKTIRIQGARNAVLFQKNIQAKADSLVYNKESQRMDFYGTPRFWAKNSELNGDTLSIYTQSDTLIRFVHLRNNAFCNNNLDSSDYFNQLAGREIKAYFSENKLVKAEVNGNAQTIFFPEQKDSSTIKREGMNSLSASFLRVYLDSGEVKKVSFIDQPEGKFLPIDQLDGATTKLKGFQWNEALRPKSWLEY